MSRSIESITEEMLTLREHCHKYSSEAQKTRKEIAALKAELTWWRKTFGPEETATL